MLGLASDEERREFEQMCAQHPEVLEARVSFEIAMEKTAMENAVAPPSLLKNKIFEEIKADAEPQVRRLDTRPAAPVRKMGWIKYAAAASVILLAGSVYYNIDLSNKNKSLQADNRTLKAENDKAVAKLKGMNEDMSVLTGNPNVKMASMKGTEVSPQSYATVYWDTTSHDVYLLTNNLPEPASDKQYQLWAIFNGKPVDLGVFEFKKERLLIQAKHAQGAEAFAITLEKKGGSPTPQGQMLVQGKL